MPTEHEAKVLDIDPGDIAKRVIDAGGHVVGSSMQYRYVFDIEPADPSRWIRLRMSGSKTTLAVKHIRHDGISGTDEVEVTVDDFEKTHRLLQLQGFEAKSYQENHRSSFMLNGAEVEVDTWPLIEDHPYMEIEGHDREHVVEVAQMLGFTEDQLTGMNTTKVYAHYGIDLAAISELRFK
jgi:adenylate cyclase, class 2